MNKFRRRTFVTRDGLNLVADVAGPETAKAVILLHGGGQTRASWSRTMHRLLDRGYHVMAYDARGHGESDWSPDGDYSIAALASDLRTIFATLRKPIALVGASMGGITGFYTIGNETNPFVSALIMVDTVLSPATVGAHRIRTFMAAHRDGFGSVEEAAQVIAAHGSNPTRKPNPDRIRNSLRRRDDGRWYWHWDQRVLAASPEMEPPAVSRKLIAVSDKVTVPTLLIRGGKSDFVDDAGVAEMRRLVPQTQVLEVAGAGHTMAGDANDAFNNGVLSFLEQNHRSS